MLLFLGGLPEPAQPDQPGHPAAAQGGPQGAAGGVWAGVHAQVATLLLLLLLLLLSLSLLSGPTSRAMTAASG